ncbi:hypothetical protein [Bacillus rhizoplanae]|uniref:hypothetical protein n=1 Tax=Bacillus rhizoplanae TaxID=2880966 RepID=UPI003D19964F
MKKFIIVLAISFSLILSSLGVATPASADVIDSNKVELYKGENVKSTHLYINFLNHVSYSAKVYPWSNHSVIVTFKDPDGDVIDRTVVAPGGRVGNFFFWKMQTGYYSLTLDCYGTAKDCRASGEITEMD